MVNREVYVKKAYNEEMASNGISIIDLQEEASQDNYLPFNKLRITNLGGEQIWVYLDAQPIASNPPDYVIGNGLGIDEGFLEGIQYNTVSLVNKGTGTIAADTIIVRVAKVEEVAL
jgi:hypothetical protein